MVSNLTREALHFDLSEYVPEPSSITCVRVYLPPPIRSACGESDVVGEPLWQGGRQRPAALFSCKDPRLYFLSSFCLI